MAVALLILNRGGDDVLVTTVLWLVSADRDGWRRVLIRESAIALWKGRAVNEDFSERFRDLSIFCHYAWWGGGWSSLRSVWDLSIRQLRQRKTSVATTTHRDDSNMPMLTIIQEVPRA